MQVETFWFLRQERVSQKNNSWNETGIPGDVLMLLAAIRGGVNSLMAEAI